MSNQRIENLYSQIVNKANQLIPVEREKVILNAEIEPGVVSHFYCFYDQDGNLTNSGIFQKIRSKSK